MNLTGKNISFRQQKSTPSAYRALFLLALILGAVFILRGIELNQIQSPFLPTATPTRVTASFRLEGETQFLAGNLEQAIQAYQQAASLEPENAEILTELARIQVYSSALLTTDAEKRQRLEEALQSLDRAVQIAPDNSMVHAMRAFALDWYASPALIGESWQRKLNDAEQAAVRALQLDNRNALAMAYYAEILVDQQKFVQAEQQIRQALEVDSSLMDVHRVNAYVQETFGNYGEAINEYKKAVQINPNLTFLYISIGVNYRQLKQYQIALDFFSKAASINEQLGVRDPIPYLAIAKTYSQMGEFFAAALNVRKALRFNPTNPDVYGSLGMVYFKSRNYESAIPALRCAVRGCDAQTSCEVRRCDPQTDPEVVIEGMPLTTNTVVYYYTYGSVLAGMHRPNDNYCDEALSVLGEVRAGFAGDATIMAIVEASEKICNSFGVSR